MSRPISDAELEAFLDEELGAELSAEVERALRGDEELRGRLVHILNRRNSGVHTVGEIWRRHRLCVPTREELGGYLLGILPEEHADYIRFRVEVLGCPYTIANLRDLEAQGAAGKQPQQPESQQARRRRIYQSSIGMLRDE